MYIIYRKRIKTIKMICHNKNCIYQNSEDNSCEQNEKDAVQINNKVVCMICKELF